MNFRRPFSAQIFDNDQIRIVDSDGSLVTLFPRLSDDLDKDFERARAIAGADVIEDMEVLRSSSPLCGRG